MKRRFVYLHGFASGALSRKARCFRERLAAAGHTLEVPDLSGGDFESLTVGSQLRIVEETVHGGPVTLIGSSMGGYLAALYASRHPEVEKLLLLAPAFSIRPALAGDGGDGSSREMARYRQVARLSLFGGPDARSWLRDRRGKPAVGA